VGSFRALGGLSSQNDLGDAHRQLVLERLEPSGGFHVLIILFTGAPRFIARLFTGRADAEVVGARRLIGRVLAKFEGTFFRRALREVSGQFRVALAVGGRQRLGLGQRLLRVSEGGQVLIDQRIEVAGRAGLGAAGFFDRFSGWRFRRRFFGGFGFTRGGGGGFWAMGFSVGRCRTPFTACGPYGQPNRREDSKSGKP
jgi:hypothetical protein